MWLSSSSDVEAVSERIGNGLVGRDRLVFIPGIDSNPHRVSVTRGVCALVLVIFFSLRPSSRVAVTVKDITVVDGHHLVAGDFDYGLFHNGAAQVLNYCPVSIFTIQRDSESQAGSPWNNHVVCAEVRESNQQLLILISCARVVCNHDRLPHSFDPQDLAEAPVRIKLVSEFARSHGVFEPTQQPSNEHPLSTPRWMTSLSRTSTFDPDGPGVDDDYSFDLSDPPMEPPLDVRQQLNASGDNLQNLQDELRQAELEAQKKCLVDSFYNEVSHTYGLCPEGRIDFSQFGIDPDGKTLYWTPEDKISVAAMRGGFRFLALDMLAKRYGTGGTYALRRSLRLTYYRSRVSRGLCKEAVKTLQSAEETLPKNIESIELNDLSGATNNVIGTTGDVKTALKSIEDPQMDIAWVTQATKDLAGVREAMTRMRDELANNLAKLSGVDDRKSEVEKHLARECQKLTETDDTEIQQDRMSRALPS